MQMIVTSPMARTAARRTSGRPPSSKARRWARARPTSCSTGRKKPGARTKVLNQSTESEAKASSPSVRRENDRKA